MRIFIFYIIMCTLSVGFTFAGEDYKEVILFSRYIDGYWQIWVKQISDGQEYQVTFSKVDKRLPRYSAEEETLIYHTANSEVFLLDIQNGITRELLSGFGIIMDYDLSSDGKSVVFTRLNPDVSGNSDLWMLDLSTNKTKYLTNDQGFQHQPCWSGDKKEVVFVYNNDIWLLTAKNAVKRELTSDTGYDMFPSFSPKREEIVYVSNQSGDYEIMLVDSGNQQKKRLTDSWGIDTSPVFSPDGKNIVFVSLRSGDFQLWTMDRTGKNQKQITFGDAQSQDPFWCNMKLTSLNNLKRRAKR